VGIIALVIGEEEIRRYREMTPEERFEIFRQLMDFAWDLLLELPEEERRRRLAYAEAQHAEASARLEAKFRSLP
jgi:hypothetical protein